MNPIELGKFIANLRNEKKLTQEELAEKLYIDKRKISRWECGTSIPDFETLIKLSEILDVSLYELSICQRIKDESINKKILNKFKSIKDLKKLKLKKILCICISILLGIFFALTTIYTIDNYGTVGIYKFESLDDDFYIAGNYIYANGNHFFNIADYGYKYNNKNTDSLTTKYEIYKGLDRITHLEYSNDAYTLHNYFYLSNNNSELRDKLNEKDILTIKIQYLNNDLKTEFKTYNFKLGKLFTNILL